MMGFVANFHAFEECLAPFAHLILKNFCSPENSLDHCKEQKQGQLFVQSMVEKSVGLAVIDCCFLFESKSLESFVLDQKSMKTLYLYVDWAN